MRIASTVMMGLLAACASTARIADPIALDFRQQEGLEERHALAVRNAFDSLFARVVAADDRDAPARVVLTTVESARAPYAERVRVRGDNTVQGNSAERCGIVRYVVLAGATQLAAEEFALDCDGAGRPDYRRAGLRAADAVARVLRP